MTRIHIHLHRKTADNNGWEESKHPRRDDGKFGSGSGGVSKEAHEDAAASYRAKADRESDPAEKKRLLAVAEGHEAQVKGEGGSKEKTAAAHAEVNIAEHARNIQSGGKHVLGKDIPAAQAETIARASAAAKEAGRSKKMSKADALKAARVEYASASAGKGNYAKAAELYEAAGDADKARASKALAQRYGHTKEGQGEKSGDDAAEAAKARKQAGSASGETKAHLEQLADAYEARAKDPESNELSKKISGLKDQVLHSQSKK